MYTFKGKDISVIAVQLSATGYERNVIDCSRQKAERHVLSKSESL